MHVANLPAASRPRQLTTAQITHTYAVSVMSSSFAHYNSPPGRLAGRCGRRCGLVDSRDTGVGGARSAAERLLSRRAVDLQRTREVARDVPRGNAVLPAAHPARALSPDPTRGAGEAARTGRSLLTSVARRALWAGRSLLAAVALQALRACRAGRALDRAVEVERRERPVPDVKARERAVRDVAPGDGTVLDLLAGDQHCGTRCPAECDRERQAGDHHRGRGAVSEDATHSSLLVL